MSSTPYDPLDRRGAKTINGQLTQYLYDGFDIAQELDASGVAAYLRSPFIDEPLIRNGSEFYLADTLNSTVGLSDSAGSVATSYSYEPFGNASIQGAASTNPFQFTGRENDGTGLYYYRSRYYAPTLHRFIKEDPLGFLAGDMNVYAYVFNNPIASSDPSGAVTFEDECGNVIEAELSITIAFINIQYDFYGKYSFNFLANLGLGGGVDISVNRPKNPFGSIAIGGRHLGFGTYIRPGPEAPYTQGGLVSVGYSVQLIPLNVQVPLGEWQAIQRYPESYPPIKIPRCLFEKNAMAARPPKP